MKFNRFYQKLILTFTLSILLCISIPFISHAQGTSTSPATQNVPFYQTNDFWGKVTLAILTTSLGALTGYLTSEKKRRDESIELSYAMNRLNVLEFKKDIREKISIRYGIHYEVSDLYVMYCDIENTGKKVIKNENIIFELSPANLGILDVFFEPPLDDNSMGLEEERIENLRTGEVKKQYKIRNILSGQKIGFRFIGARINQQDPVPELFVYNERESKVQLVPRSYKKENDENYRITRFITLFLLFLILPLVLSTIPFYGGIVSGLTKLVIFVLILPHINTFSTKISSLLILLSQKIREQRYGIIQNITGDSNQIVGAISGGSAIGEVEGNVHLERDDDPV